MDLGLRGRTALVCGASSGLGLASAEALAGEGANVTMFARRRDVLEREADRIGALAVRGDVTLPQDLERAVAMTLEAFGGLDILVWNSGGPPAGTGIDVTPDSLEQAVELMLTPAVRLVGLCLPHLERSDGGRILAITSLAAKEPTAHLALSNALRPAVTGWLKTLAGEVARDGVTVNHMATGNVMTDRIIQIDEAAAQQSGRPREEVTRDRLSNIPMGRLGTIEEYGEICAFLCSRQAGYITGQTIAVDGGMLRGVY